MAEGAPAPAGNPPPFPEGDPRNALYFENMAALQHGYERSQASFGEQRANARTNAEYATGQIGKQEPEGFRNLRNRANSEGLLQSGTLAGRTGTLGSQFGARRFAVTHGLQEREGALTRAEQGAKERRELGEKNAATRALEEGKTWLLNNPSAAEDIAGSPGGKLPMAPAAPRAAAARRINLRNPQVDLDIAGTRRAARRKMIGVR